MTSTFSIGRRLLLLGGALLLLLAAPLGERPAKADFITSEIKDLICPPGGPECLETVTQPFIIEPITDPINSFTVIKNILIQPQESFRVIHIAAGLWPEKDLKHLGFLCRNAECTEITGFDPAFVSFPQDPPPIFQTDIPDLHGLTSVGTVIPEIKLVSPEEAIAWLPDRPTFRDFFATRNVIPGGQVAVLFAHIPEPATLALFAVGLVGLGAAARQRR